jgi:hypothetical protein
MGGFKVISLIIAPFKQYPLLGYKNVSFKAFCKYGTFGLREKSKVPKRRKLKRSDPAESPCPL